MTRRPGMTMTELLVAIFVVAIGLAGVMSMVPFGAKQMSDALVADRSTSLAHTIDGMMRSFWQEKVLDDTSGNGSGEDFWLAMDNAASRGSPPTALPTGVTSLLVDKTDPSASFPVFIDPMGWNVARPSTASNNWVGDGGETFIPRRTLSTFPNADNAVRAWSQADGFTWDDNQDGAVPKISGSVVREYRYNALAVVQRPSNNQRNTATLKVVVFSNRRPRFFPAGTEAVVPASAGVTMTPQSTAIQIPLNQIPATSEVRKGGWIMDATLTSTSKGILRHANFYRVVSALDNGSTNSSGVPVLDVELHTAIKRVDGDLTAYTGTLVLLPGVAGVFERPLLTAP